MSSPQESQRRSFVVPLDDDWEAVYWMEPQGSEIVIGGVEIRPRGDLARGGLTARTIRAKVHPGMAVRQFRAIVAEHLDPDSSEYFGGVVAIMLAKPGGATAWRGDGRDYLRGQADQSPWLPALDKLSPGAPRQDRLGRLAETAALYVHTRNAGHPAPNRLVAERQGRAPEHVRDDLYAARRLGLLTESGGKGRAGGDLTDKARAILQEANE